MPPGAVADLSPTSSSSPSGLSIVVWTVMAVVPLFSPFCGARLPACVLRTRKAGGIRTWCFRGRERPAAAGHVGRGRERDRPGAAYPRPPQGGAPAPGAVQEISARRTRTGDQGPGTRDRGPGTRVHTAGHRTGAASAWYADSGLATAVGPATG
ncbi:hypothetical protein Shyhy02_07320 [Streptomyces hygroscopicus subsp. hygroscopicus]|nr:hypothetical protein Shyhy02_07320 [Streptomyces hygroscopicus subsp. hygroscopicus]